MPNNDYNAHLRVELEGGSYWCPRCGKKLNGAAVSQGDKREIPSIGDLSVCSGCGMVSQFAEGKLEPFSQDAFTLLSEEEQQNLKETGVALGFSVLRMLKSKQLDS